MAAFHCTMSRTMPTPIMHLALTEEILGGDDLPPALRRLLVAERGSFLLGNTAPDVQTVSGQTREATHFYAISRSRPKETTPPAYKALLAAHRELAHPARLPPAQAAFVAGYIAHIMWDELWLDDVFLPYFRHDWGTGRERAFLHNALRTWMDRQDLQRINGTVIHALRQAEPRGWVPFVTDAHLRGWQDWLVKQFGPGRRVQTAEVFAQRLGISVLALEAIIESPQQMEARVFSRIPRAALQSFHDQGYTRSVALLTWYLSELENA